jgi:hypothetical protein
MIIQVIAWWKGGLVDQRWRGVVVVKELMV